MNDELRQLLLDNGASMVGFVETDAVDEDDIHEV